MCDSKGEIEHILNKEKKDGTESQMRYQLPWECERYKIDKV